MPITLEEFKARTQGTLPPNQPGQFPVPEGYAPSRGVLEGRLGPYAQQQPGRFWRFMSWLPATQYATAGVVRDIFGGEPGFHPVQAARTGLRSQLGYGDILREFDVLQGRPSQVVGFALDVLLDPITYVPLGALTKAGKAQKGLRILGKPLSKQVAAGERTLVGLRAPFSKRLAALPADFPGHVAAARGLEALGRAPGVRQLRAGAGELFGGLGGPGRRMAAKLPEASERRLKLAAELEDITKRKMEFEKELTGAMVGPERVVAGELAERPELVTLGFTERPVPGMAEELAQQRAELKTPEAARRAVEPSLFEAQMPREYGTPVEEIPGHFPTIQATPERYWEEQIPKIINDINTPEGWARREKKLLEAGFQPEHVERMKGMRKYITPTSLHYMMAYRKRNEVMAKLITEHGLLPPSATEKFFERHGLEHMRHLLEPQEPPGRVLKRMWDKMRGRGPSAGEEMRQFRQALAGPGEGKIGRLAKPGAIRPRRLAGSALDNDQFIIDSAKAQAFYEWEIETAVAVRNYIRDLADIAGVEDAIPKKFVDAWDKGKPVWSTRYVADKPGYTVIDDPKVAYLLRGKQVPKELAADITRLIKTTEDPGALEKMLKVFDVTQNWWKAYTLAVFPAYHIRNVVGNVWNNFLAGVDDPRAYLESLWLQTHGATNPFMRGLHKLGLEPKLTHEMKESIAGILNKSVDGVQPIDILQAARGSNVMGRGFMAKEIPGAQVGIGRQRSAPVRAGFAVGTFLEDNARLALFNHSLREGYDVPRSAYRVFKYLFDYDDLTPFERNVMKRVLPFFTWSRKNIPLQLEALIKRPGKLAVLPKGRQVIEPLGEPVNELYMARFMSKGVPIKIRKNEKTGDWEYFLLERWLPAADIERITSPRRIGETALELLTPLIKAPIEWWLNYNFYFDTETEQYPGQRGTFLGVNMPRKVINALRNIRLLNELHRTNPGSIFGTREEPSVFGVRPLTTPRDLPASSRAINFLIGARLYSYDLQRARDAWWWKHRTTRLELMRGLEKAKRAGNIQEYQRILRELAELQEEAAMVSMYD